VKTLWIISSGLCGIAAILFVVGQDYDKAFIAAVLGCVAWFLSYRTQLVQKNKENEEDQF